MTDERAAVLFEQMLSAAEDAVSYVEGMTEADFLADRRTQQAVSLNLLLIGELANRLMKHYEIARQHPSLPLRQMQGMRNRIAHGYVHLSMEVIWETVTTSLPELIDALPSIIQSAPDPRSDSNGDA
jgi:uncharacterized protein with HEPN domain